MTAFYSNIRGWAWVFGIGLVAGAGSAHADLSNFMYTPTDCNGMYTKLSGEIAHLKSSNCSHSNKTAFKTLTDSIRTFGDNAANTCNKLNPNPHHSDLLGLGKEFEDYKKECDKTFAASFKANLGIIGAATAGDNGPARIVLQANQNCATQYYNAVKAVASFDTFALSSCKPSNKAEFEALAKSTLQMGTDAAKQCAKENTPEAKKDQADLLVRGALFEKNRVACEAQMNSVPLNTAAFNVGADCATLHADAVKAVTAARNWFENKLAIGTCRLVNKGEFDALVKSTLKTGTDAANQCAKEKTAEAKKNQQDLLAQGKLFEQSRETCAAHMAAIPKCKKAYDTIHDYIFLESNEAKKGCDNHANWQNVTKLTDGLMQATNNMMADELATACAQAFSQSDIGKLEKYLDAPFSCINLYCGNVDTSGKPQNMHGKPYGSLSCSVDFASSIPPLLID